MLHTTNNYDGKTAGLSGEIQRNSPIFISLCAPCSGWNTKKSQHRSLVFILLFFLPRRGTISNASFTRAEIFVFNHRSPALIAMRALPANDSHTKPVVTT